MTTIPPQEQSRQPGIEAQMTPRPHSFMEDYKAAGKLDGKVALITGGDSGIGRAVAIAFAKEGADVAIVYLDEEQDAETTREHVEAEGVNCLLIAGDIRSKEFCESAVQRAASELGGLNILVNNAAVQYDQKDVRDISQEQLLKTFETNVFGMFYMTQAAIGHMKEGDTIINTASIVAYRGHPVLIDYGATKGAIVGFTRSLSANIGEKKIRVNAVAPGPVWTPLIPSSFDAGQVAEFGKDTVFGRPGEPDEMAPSYVFLASDDSCFMTGQVLHPNGGTVING